VKKKSKNEREPREPCETLLDGKCKCKKLWCTKGCGYCQRHCSCPKRRPLRDHPVPEKTECKKGTNGKALCNYEWCTNHPTLCSKCCKTCNEPKKDITYVSARPQRERQVATYIEDDAEEDTEEDIDEGVDHETTSQRAVQSLKDLYLAFPPTISIKNMPSERCREQVNAGTVIQTTGNARRAEQTMVRLLCEVMAKCAEIILPGDPAFLLSRATELLQAKRSEPSLEKKAAVADKLVANMSTLIVGLAKGTFGYRVARAIAVESITPKELKLHFPEQRSLLTFGAHGRSKARKDFNQMYFHEQDIINTKRQVARVPEELIHKAVSHILSSGMVNCLSWGTKVVTIPGTGVSVTLPKVTRKMSKEDMFRNYKYNQKSGAILQDRVSTRTRSRNEDASIPMLGRTSYLAIVDAITHDEEKLTQSICYVTDLLINEQMATLQRIIDDMVAPVNKKDMTRYLCVLQNFLKYQYEDHVQRDDAVSCREARVSSSLLLLLTFAICDVSCAPMILSTVSRIL
jgi:hypothetical protein